MELVARAGKTPEAHALEAMVGLQMREPHLDAVSLRRAIFPILKIRFR
jgi:hypothetical protein